MATSEASYKTEMPAKHSLLRIPVRPQHNSTTASSCDKYQALLASNATMAAQIRAVEFFDIKLDCLQSVVNFINACIRLDYVIFKDSRKALHQLTVEAVEYVMREAIRKMQSIRYIGFPDHKLGDAGFQKIIPFLRGASFKGCDFTRMKLGESSLCEIASLLQTSELEELHLRGNEDAFTPKSRAALCAALRTNGKLKVLNVADTGLGAKDIAEIIEVTRVKELNVAQNLCDDGCDLPRLFNAIQNNQHIEKLVMHGVLGDVDEVPDLEARWNALVTAVKNNGKIQQIITKEPGVDGEEGAEAGSEQAKINALSDHLETILRSHRTSLPESPK